MSEKLLTPAGFEPMVYNDDDDDSVVVNETLR